MAAKEYVQKTFCRIATARFVLSANLSEETGLSDLESTQEVLEGSSNILSKPARETRQLAAAMQVLAGHYEELCASQMQHSLEALILTPDIIHQVHRVLMQDLVHNPGEARLAPAYGGFSRMGIYIYQPPELVPSLLLTICDLYNQALREIAASSEQMPLLYRLAAVLFVQLATVHPFSDGNGRLARLLASHVLRSVTPFPVTPHADGTASNRAMFLDAIMAARSEDSKAFLHLSAPKHFTALMIQAGWECWQSCFVDMEKSAGLSSPNHLA